MHNYDNHFLKAKNISTENWDLDITLNSYRNLIFSIGLLCKKKLKSISYLYIATSSLRSCSLEKSLVIIGFPWIATILYPILNVWKNEEKQNSGAVRNYLLVLSPKWITLNANISVSSGICSWVWSYVPIFCLQVWWCFNEIKRTKELVSSKPNLFLLI